MDMARVLGDCNRDEADLLRRAMGSKRGVERIESHQGEALCRDGAPRAWPATRPTRSTCRSCPSRTSASPRATRCPSPSSSTPARGSSCTTRPRSWPRCCAPSRWASTRRSRWSTTPAGTASRCCRPDLALVRAAADLELGSRSTPRRRPGSTPACVDGAADRVGARHPRPDPGAPARRGVRRTARAGLGPRDRHGRRRADRGGARGAAVRRPGRPVPAGRAGRAASWRRWRPPGVFDRRSSVEPRQALWNAGWTESEEHLEGVRVAGAGPDAARAWTVVEITMADLWATGITPGGAPLRAPARPAARGRDHGGRRHRDRRGRAPDPRRRAGHPPAAAGHRRRRHLPQPRGRDRDAQRDLHGRGVAALPQGRRQRRGHGDPRHPGAPGRRHQPARRPARADRGGPPRGRAGARAPGTAPATSTDARGVSYVGRDVAQVGRGVTCVGR